jgi:hypothetical protein
MYKMRFRKWGAFKNKTKRRGNFVTGTVPGSNSRLQVDGTLPNDPGQGNAAAPDEPLLSPVAPNPTDPYLHPKRALAAIHEWIDANYSAQMWRVGSQGVQTGTTHGPQHSHGFLEVHVIVKFAFALYSRNEQLLAGKALRKAFVVLEDAIFDKSPEMILHMIHIMVDLVLRRQEDVLNMFLAQFSGIAGCHLPANHPLVRVSTNLGHISDGIEHWLLKALCCAINTFVSHVGDKYMELPHLHWLKGVVEPIGNRQLKKDPSAVTRQAKIYGNEPPSLVSSIGRQSMLMDSKKARHDGNPHFSGFCTLHSWMTFLAATATMSSRWSDASEIWQNLADLESSSPWQHPIAVVEQLWLARDASLKVGGTAHIKLGEMALRRAKAYLEDISNHEA